MNPLGKLARTAATVVAVTSGVWLSGCGGSSPGDSAASPASPRAAVLDGSLDMAAMVEALDEQFCQSSMSSSTSLAGYVRGSCRSTTGVGRYVFTVFDSHDELEAYLGNRHCEDGFYYATGPTWLGAAVTPKDVVTLTDAGATKTNCE